ncbi:restriction endonuclease [Photobacterium frigidiphilum]|uniref:Restriction endonuclease n=1 Tax=Photobacterium frigidiphilum TaxID=264736 RepID=A0A2T3JA81_9GAMM|nr:restriction endonuclease [Photobacterium frigidiphilum]PSU45756.1 restriction endonuclease [Photobacterium frigidiphilum]
MTAFDALLIIVGLALCNFYLRPAFNRHVFNVKRAEKVLKKMQSIEHNGAKFAYLRKVDPFVFEELLLTAFEHKGHRIERNKRYTGDFGIDGKVIIDGQLTLIQAKRYRRYINPRHVAEFAALCRQKNTKGLFIHTGKTGKQSYQHTTANVRIISGARLLTLLEGIDEKR